MEKRILIFFGKTGAGKDYVANLFAKEFGFYIYDADTDLTPEMIYAIKHQLEFTEEMRARYFEVVALRMNELLEINKKIVMTQGLFKNKNRHELMNIFPFAEWIWVEADENIIVERVLQRKSLVTLEYARKINKFFEEPDFSCYKLLNNLGEPELMAQINAIMSCT